MKNLLKLLFLSLLGFPGITIAQQIEFSPVSNVEMLIANIFGVQCDGVTNVTHSPVLEAIGRFENGDIIGTSSGLVMTTGRVAGSGTSSDNQNSWGPQANGDMDIDIYAVANGAPSGSVDACFVEFDFTPSISDTIRFTYIFASEEYPEYSGTQYTDRFLFLVSENGSASSNIAVLPGTSTAVEINSINQFTNTQYYINNQMGVSPSSSYFVFDGYTTPLTAQFFAQVGSTYHIKLVIADVEDGIYDSALFLEEQESYNDISGDLMVNGLPAEGLLEIFNFVGDTSLAIPVYSAVVANGAYAADSLSTGMYHIRFTPDVVLYPNTPPIYFTNGDTWSGAQEIGLPCFLNSGDISSTALNVMDGSASITGIIGIDTSFTKSSIEPFEGALVKLINEMNQTVAFTYSDITGAYNFSSIPAGTYHILLDVPYIPQLNVHSVKITDNEYYSGADFSILTDGITAENNLALSVEDVVTFNALIYPNPAKDRMVIVHNSQEPVDYLMYQLDGNIAKAGRLNIGKTELNLSDLTNGVYVLSLGDYKREKIVVAR